MEARRLRPAPPPPALTFSSFVFRVVKDDIGNFVLRGPHVSAGQRHLDPMSIDSAETRFRPGALPAVTMRRLLLSLALSPLPSAAAGGTGHRKGGEFTVKAAPTITLKLIVPTQLKKVARIKDNIVIPIPAPKDKNLDLGWTDPAPESGRTSYYYCRGEQINGELVWASPMWIKSE
jgi:hypothetical protein